jgi:hypothetical protein
MPYQCTHCGETHDDLPDIAADRPDHWWSVPEKDRKRKIQFTADTCVIDRRDYFIRGVLFLPIHDHERPLGFGVWVSQKKENFMKYVRNPNTDKIGPFFGWLCTNIRYYKDDTTSLKTMAHFFADNRRPMIELEPTEHPLAVDQREGITLEKAWEIVHFYGKKN